MSKSNARTLHWRGACYASVLQIKTPAPRTGNGRSHFIPHSAFSSDAVDVVDLVEAALHGDHQAALLGVEAAQGGGRLDGDAGLGEVLADGIGQGVGLGLTEAVGDAQPGIIGEAALADHGRQDLGGLLLAPGLLGGDDLTILGVAAGTDAQHRSELRLGGADTAVACQVVHGLQAEENVGVVLICPHLGHDLLEGQSLIHQISDLLNDHGLLGTGGEGVEDVDPGVGMGLREILGSLLGGVVAAGEVPGNGDTEGHVRITEGIEPFLGIGTGGAGFALVGLQVIDHAPDIQRLGIDVLALAGDDLHGYGGIVDPLDVEDVGGGIGNDLITHRKLLISAEIGCISLNYDTILAHFDRSVKIPGGNVDSIRNSTGSRIRV